MLLELGEGYEYISISVCGGRKEGASERHVVTSVFRSDVCVDRFDIRCRINEVILLPFQDETNYA